MDTLEERHTCDETAAQIVVFNTKNDDYLSAMIAIQEHEKAVGIAVEGDHLGADNSISLIQIYAPKCNVVYIIDVLADRHLLKRYDGVGKILMSKDIVKVMHECAKPSAALLCQHGLMMANVFDVQVADIELQMLYERTRFPISRTMLKIVEKSEIKTDVSHYIERDTITKLNYWEQRPLTDEMIKFATQDVTLFVPKLHKKLTDELEEKSAFTPFQYMVQECLYSAVTDKYKHLKEPYHVATFARLKEDLENITEDMRSYSKLNPYDQYTINQWHLSAKDMKRIYYYRDRKEFAWDESPRHIRVFICKHYMRFAVEIKRDLKTTTDPGRYLPYISEMKSLKSYRFIQAAMEGLYKSVSDQIRRMDMPEILQTIKHLADKYPDTPYGEATFNAREIRVLQKLRLTKNTVGLAYRGKYIPAPPCVVAFVCLEMLKTMKEIEEHCTNVETATTLTENQMYHYVYLATSASFPVIRRKAGDVLPIVKRFMKRKYTSAVPRTVRSTVPCIGENPIKRGGRNKGNGANFKRKRGDSGPMGVKQARGFYAAVDLAASAT